MTAAPDAHPEAWRRLPAADRRQRSKPPRVRGRVRNLRQLPVTGLPRRPPEGPAKPIPTSAPGRSTGAAPARRFLLSLPRSCRVGSGCRSNSSNGWSSHLVTSGIANSGSLFTSGHHMGLQQDTTPRVSLAAADLSTRTCRHRSQEHSNDWRTLVIHSLDDSRSSQAGRRASLTPPIRPPIAPSLRRPGSPIPARQRGRLRRVHAPGAPAASADPVRPPALPDRYRRPTLGRGFGADPGAGERGPRRNTGAQRTIS